ncbi:MAG TPA: sigma-70 family RNA polymerase sigma factor [Gemmata sp.]
MPTEARPLTRQLLKVVLGTPEVPDGDLLARFVSSRDEEAFAELVRRHGAMVFAVCRRVTGRAHDAEDAFQAAFLVLAKRAGHLTRPELLANWLYGVACRTALDARAARRRTEDRVVFAAPEPVAPEPPDDTAELRRVIDEELAQLPDKYRSAVVLCDLEGLPRTAAAQQLGIPEGTLSSRLAYARKLLAGRLTRRGVTASAGAVSAVLTRDALATTVPPRTAHTLARLAARFARERGTAPLGASPEVTSLTEGALKAMLVTRLRQAFAIGLLTCGLIGVGSALAQQLGVPVADAPPPNLPDQPPQFDPLIAQQAKRVAEPKKVGAKGVEDDDVPYGTFPSQAVVRIEEGKLIVRQRTHSTEAVAQKVGEATVVSYQTRSSVRATAHDPADIAVFDMKGNRLAPKAWKEMLKTDVHALIANDGKLPNPRELTLFKPDTLLIVLPALAAPTRAGYATTTSGGATYYAPVAPSAWGSPALPMRAQDTRPGVPAQPAPRATPAVPSVPQPAPETADSLTTPPALVPSTTATARPAPSTPAPMERK